MKSGTLIDMEAPDKNTVDPSTPKQRRHIAASSVTVSLVVYTLLIVYASCYPFSGWRDLGLAPFDYLWARLPYYWTVFDTWTNIVGYAPLGLLITLCLQAKIRTAPAIITSILASMVLSACMEAIQTYLPTRVSSNVDLFTNTLGGLLGALSALMANRYLLQNSRLIEWQKHWFSHGASRGLVIIGLWPLALIYPQNHVFGLGNVLPLFAHLLSDLFETPIDLTTWWINNAHLSAYQYWLSEILISSCGLTGAALAFLTLLRKEAPKPTLVILYLLIAGGVKSLANALFFTPENAFIWLTSGTTDGIAVGILVLIGLMFTPPVIQRRFAALALIVCLLMTNAMPPNPYFVFTLQTWSQGKFLNFNGAAQFLSALWPFLALWFLYHPIHRKTT